MYSSNEIPFERGHRGWCIYLQSADGHGSHSLYDGKVAGKQRDQTFVDTEREPRIRLAEAVEQSPRRLAGLLRAGSHHTFADRADTYRHNSAAL